MSELLKAPGYWRSLSKESARLCWFVFGSNSNGRARGEEDELRFLETFHIRQDTGQRNRKNSVANVASPALVKMPRLPQLPCPHSLGHVTMGRRNLQPEIAEGVCLNGKIKRETPTKPNDSLNW